MPLNDWLATGAYPLRLRRRSWRQGDCIRYAGPFDIDRSYAPDVLTVVDLVANDWEVVE